MVASISDTMFLCGIWDGVVANFEPSLCKELSVSECERM